MVCIAITKSFQSSKQYRVITYTVIQLDLIWLTWCVHYLIAMWDSKQPNELLTFAFISKVLFNYYHMHVTFLFV